LPRSLIVRSFLLFADSKNLSSYLFLLDVFIGVIAAFYFSNNSAHFLLLSKLFLIVNPFFFYPSLVACGYSISGFLGVIDLFIPESLLFLHMA
jgi:hypothetical protein